jgi:putative endonuclease
MFYVYIIYSIKLEKKYIGYCSDLKNRIEEHNKGESRFTSKGIPWKLVYYEAFLSKIDAQKEEKFLKTGKGRERLKFLLEDAMIKIK